jgi:hypothetical protein
VVGARYNYNFTDMRVINPHHAYFDARSLMDGDGVAVAARSLLN